MPTEGIIEVFVRRPSETEAHLLRDWIDAAAPIGEVRADVATREADTLVTQEDDSTGRFRLPSGPLLDNPWTISFKLHCKKINSNWAPTLTVTR